MHQHLPGPVSVKIKQLPHVQQPRHQVLCPATPGPPPSKPPSRTDDLFSRIAANSQRIAELKAKAERLATAKPQLPRSPPPLQAAAADQAPKEQQQQQQDRQQQQQQQETAAASTLTRSAVDTGGASASAKDTTAPHSTSTADPISTSAPSAVHGVAASNQPTDPSISSGRRASAPQATPVNASSSDPRVEPGSVPTSSRRRPQLTDAPPAAEGAVAPVSSASQLPSPPPVDTSTPLHDGLLTTRRYDGSGATTSPSSGPSPSPPTATSSVTQRPAAPPARSPSTSSSSSNSSSPPSSNPSTAMLTARITPPAGGTAATTGGATGGTATTLQAVRSGRELNPEGKARGALLRSPGVTSPSSEASAASTSQAAPSPTKFTPVAAATKPQASSTSAAASGAAAASPRMPPSSRKSIVIVSAEVSPWSSTGDLGEAMGALPVSLAARGRRVMVVTPRYLASGESASQRYVGVAQVGEPRWLDLYHGQQFRVAFHHVARHGVDWVFVDHPLYHRSGTPYGDSSGAFADNLMRFTLLSLAACEAPLCLPLGRDGYPNPSVYGQDVVFMTCDWHPAILPVLLAARYRPQGTYAAARTVVAVHDATHQGRFPESSWKHVGLLHGSREAVLSRDGGADKETHVNVLKAGITAADRLVTVSPSYAHDLVTSPAAAFGLTSLFSKRANVLHGILNGVDVTQWDPATDPHIAQQYGMETLETGKRACKAALQRNLCLSLGRNIPLLAFVGSLEYAHGPELVVALAPHLDALGCQLVVVGNGTPEYEAAMRDVQTTLHDTVRFLRDSPTSATARRVLAAADVLLVPSRTAPCGLGRLRGQRYGAVPVAHATGGLRDAIVDCNALCGLPGAEDACNVGTGWTFAPATSDALLTAVDEALRVMREEPSHWRALQRRCMTAAQDRGWNRPAQQYDQLLSML